MKKLKSKLVIIHTAVLLLSGWGVWWLILTALPKFYFTWYPFIPTFFFAIGIAFIAILDKTQILSPRKTVNLYMLLRFSKVMLSLIFAAIYFFAVRVQLKEFGLVFISFYLLYLGLETYYFYLTEKEIKKTK